jgi:hypothetical protein
MVDNDTMNRMIGAVGGVPVCEGGDEWVRDWVSEATIRSIIHAAIRAGNLVPAMATAREHLEYWAGQDVGEEDVARDEVLAVMGRTIADLRSQFGAAANIVAHVQDALRVAGFIHQSASGDQPPRPNELADCIRTLHQDLLAAKAEAADRTSYAAELEERVARAERAKARDEQAADLAAANANALMRIDNILTWHGATVGTYSHDNIVRGVAAELARVAEMKEQLSALTEAAASRDKVSRMVADLRDHSLHGQLEALQAEELRLLRLVARLVDGQQ